MEAEIKNKFLQLFNENPLMISAPGRINIIGEHTDYNMGFVLPAAIDKHIVFAIAGNNSDVHRFVSYDLDDEIDIPVNKIHKVDKQWANYLLGVIDQLNKLSKSIGGVNCVFGGNIPLGAGLSSSAALETGFAYALNELFSLGLSKIEIVKLSQMAEHGYAGVKCGIMDQFASVFGEKDTVIKLDCRSLEYQHYPLQLEGYSIILCDTQVKHTLASSEYNTRRHECESGVEILKKYNHTVESLRDVDMNLLNSHKEEFNPVVYKRCKYVVEEIQRVTDACYALSKGEISKLGELMYKTHYGLRDEYEVSCKELDVLVDIAGKSGLVTGARLMGGGFGGCTINILKNSDAGKFTNLVKTEYKKQTEKDLVIYNVSVKQGTRILN